MSEPTSAIDPELLDILRCPVAVHYKDKGDDPGRLELVKGSWLVSADSGYKYPIRNGIPVMLIEEGKIFQDTSLIHNGKGAGKDKSAEKAA